MKYYYKLFILNIGNEKILSTKVGNETIFDIMKLIESVDVEDDGVSHGKKICQNAIYASENDMQLLSLLLQRDIILYSYEGKIRKFPSERRKATASLPP